MIDNLSDVLEENEIATQAEWEKKINENQSAKQSGAKNSGTAAKSVVFVVVRAFNLSASFPAYFLYEAELQMQDEYPI